MSEIYSSASGSYSNYLSERQNDSITKTIKEESAKQNMWNLMYTGAVVRSVGEVGQKIDSVNYNIQRMSTGIQTSINQNTYMVAASSTLLANSFNEGFNELNNTLDLGFGGVQNAIGNMSASMSAGFDRLQKTVNTWGTEICEKLDAIHDIVNNPLLTASRELFRRAQANAQKQFYEEALEDITQAVEKNKTDYLSWALMGKIYLFGMSEFSNVVDVQKALESFINACKYITPDIDESEEAKKMAAEFYFYVGYANYILSNESRLANNTDDVTKYLEVSVKANAKSYALSSAMLESAYNQARALTLLNQNEKAISVLEEVIRADGLYSIKALGDSDLKSIEDNIVSLIKNLRDECQQKTKELLTEFSNDYELIGGEYCENIKKLIAKCEELIASETPYLDIRAGYEALLIEINNKQFPIDLLVYENKIYDGNRLQKTLEVGNINKVWKEKSSTSIFRQDSDILAQYRSKIGKLNEGYNGYTETIQILQLKDTFRKLSDFGFIINESSFNYLYDKEEKKIIDREIANSGSWNRLYCYYLKYEYISDYGKPGKLIIGDFEIECKRCFNDHDGTYFYSDTDDLRKKCICIEDKENDEEYWDLKEEELSKDNPNEFYKDKNTLLRIDYKTGITVYQRGVISKKELQEIRAAEHPLLEKQRKIEESRAKQIEAEKQRKENEAAEKARYAEIKQQEEIKEKNFKPLKVLFVIIGILLFIPAVKLGGHVWQKCGYVIFGSLYVTIFLTLYEILNIKIKSMSLSHNLGDIIVTPFGFWNTPAIIAGALKIGLSVGHPVIGTLIGIGISFIEVIIVGIVADKL